MWDALPRSGVRRRKKFLAFPGARKSPFWAGCIIGQSKAF